ncbi:hypothetical protein HC031_21260 [Planosporangium thailandense]|uniref:Lipoprotein n=1 Tax=Planosporangium thailandense TaxID=765197 RepID=A0ABX0Y1J3_9ACTN|nr:hypothetical protein [Planosporangium thailandense]NJC72227.1 hypothetical protein [Planosporangium thailandense]
MAVLLVISTVGCGDGRGGTTAVPATKAALTYGNGPARDRSITYQPDVVFVEGGPDVIRSATGNGLTWTIAGNARGADGVRVGKVVYVTSRAVGRAVEVRRVGADLAVTLAPVTLTEVFRDAHFTVDRDIDQGALVYQEIPDFPGAVTVPTEPPASAAPTVTTTTALRSGAVTSNAVLHPMGPARTDGGVLPPAREGNVTVSIAGWDAQPYRNPGVLGLKFGRKADDALKVFVDFSAKVSNLRLRLDVRITNGVLDPLSTVALEGLKSVGISIAAGAANGADDNRKIRFEVPVEASIPVAGTPFVFSTSWKIIVATALSGRNTTVKADGEWRVDGTVGVVEGRIVTPSFAVSRSLLDSITGLSVGVSGVAVAIEFKVQLGIGVPVASAGPYIKLVVDVGVTNGSALGAPLARCTGATLDGKVGGGFGLSLSSAVTDALEKLLRKAKFELEKEILTPFVHKQQTQPDVPLCRG